MLRYQQRRKVRAPFKVAVVAVMVIAFAFSPVFETVSWLQSNVQAASAADAIGPKESWLGNHAGRYALEETSNVTGAGSLYIPLYIENTGSDTDPATYPPTNVTMRAFDFAMGYNVGRYANATFRWCEGTSRQAQTGAVKSTISFTIPKECFKYVPTLNAWTTDLRAFIDGEGRVQFRLNFQSPNDGHQLLGYSTRNGQRGFAVANRYRCDPGGDQRGCYSYYNYNIPFGVPCSIKARTEASASVYDGDNSTSSTIYSIQYNRSFSVGIYDVTAGRWVTIKRTEGGLGNNQNMTYYFDVLPEHRYQFRVDNVYTNNVLQFRLPYNSIESNNDCSWNLNPSVTVDPETSEGATNGLDVEYFMPNDGATTSDPVQWQLSRCIVNAGTGSAAYSKAADNTTNGVNTYNALGANCTQVTTQSNQTINRGTVNKLGERLNQSVPDLDPGSRLCYVLSVNAPSDNAPANRWRHSTPACVIIAKKPKVHILGGDLIVGKGQTSDVYGSRSVRNAGGGTRYYGSWAEYAVLASGFVHNFASASGYSGGTSNNHFCDVSLLTFTNAGTTFCKDTNDSVSQGLYNLDSRTLPDVASRFSGTQGISGGTVNVSTANGIYADNTTGSITVTSRGGTVEKGKSVVIVAPRATVTIDRDINYTTASDLKTMADIPQVVIIADRINIRSNVENVDAWLVATGVNGVINTCSNVTDPVAQLRSTNCNRQLTVNGPVIARHLYLYRTANAGKDANAADPAEVFNLRPDAYLWATNYNQKAGRLQTITSKELPPRF